MKVWCVNCGEALERYALRIPGTVCECGGRLFSSSPPTVPKRHPPAPPLPDPIKPYDLTPRDKLVLKALRIAAD